MKDYPSIPKVLEKLIGKDCIAFKKYDGTQIRVEWSPKKDWHKFATRGQLFGETHQTFGCAYQIFNDTHSEALTKAIKDNYPKAEGAVAFLEFLGPNSFAGMHENDDPKELVLFDVNILKRGMVSPEDFVSQFSHLRSAEVVYTGKLDDEFITQVREKQIPNIDEGVVAKGGERHNFWLCKIKTWDYLKKIQKHFGTSWGSYWE